MDEFKQWMLAIWLYAVIGTFTAGHWIHTYQRNHLCSPPLWLTHLVGVFLLAAWPFYLLTAMFDYE